MVGITPPYCLHVYMSTFLKHVNFMGGVGLGFGGGVVIGVTVNLTSDFNITASCDML